MVDRCCPTKALLFLLPFSIRDVCTFSNHYIILRLFQVDLHIKEMLRLLLGTSLQVNYLGIFLPSQDNDQYVISAHGNL